MEVQRDFKELLELFNAHRVEYIIVGSYALAFHGSPRFTGAIDIFVRPTSENAQKILSALADFGFGSLNLTVDDFQNIDSVVQLGYPPVRIDIITSLTGVTREEASRGKQAGPHGDVPFFFLGTIHSQQTCNRPEERSGRPRGIGRRVNKNFRTI